MTALDEPCEACGNRMRDILQSIRRHEPERTIELFRSLTDEERLGLHHWLVGTLRRPPLDKPTKAYQALVALLDALAWDLALHTPDPLSPEFEYLGERYVMPLEHPRVTADLAGGA